MVICESCGSVELNIMVMCESYGSVELNIMVTYASLMAQLS